MRSIRIAVALALATSMLFAGHALAGSDEGTKELRAGDYVSVHIDNSDGDALEITVFIKVKEGANINAYFLDEDNYNSYREGGDFEAWEDYSEEDTDEVDETFVFATEGSFYLVFDTTATGNETTTAEYEVTWDSAWDLGFNWLWCIVALVVLVIITATLAFMNRSKDADRGLD